MDNGAQRLYMFNQDGTVKATSEEKQIEQRLASLKAKMAEAGIDTTGNPDIPPPNNPYFKDFVEDETLHINNDQERTHE